MKILIHWLKSEYLVLLFALGIGALIMAPSFYFRYFNPEYQGIDLFRSDAELNYVAQIQEVYDGHPSLGNIYLEDGKDVPAGIQQPLSANVVAGLGKMMRMDAATINLYSKLILPFFLTLLTFYFLLFLVKNRALAFLGSAFIMLAPATLGFFHVGGIFDMIVRGNFAASDYQFLTYARSINPQFSSLLFFGYFLVLWKWLFGESNKKVYGVLSALILGLSFYTYFFVYSFISVFSFFLFIYFVWCKEWIKVKAIFWVGLVGLIMATPILYNMYALSQGPYYAGATERVGAFPSHKFIFSQVWWGAFIIFLLSYRKISEHSVRLFLSLFLLVSLVLTNQQMLTGHMIPAPQHYHWYYIAPVVGAFFVIGFGFLVKKYLSEKWLNWFAVLLVSMFFWLGFLFQKQSYIKYLPEVVAEQKYSTALQWLRENTPPDSTIFSEDDFAHLVVVFTSNNAYYHRGLTDFPIPPERIKHALFLNIFLDGVTSEEALAYFTQHRNRIGSWLYGEHYRQRHGCSGCFSEEMFTNLVNDYQMFSRQDFVASIKKYPIKYLVWDKEKDPNWNLDQYLGVPIFTSGPVQIYSL